MLPTQLNKRTKRCLGGRLLVPLCTLAAATNAVGSLAWVSDTHLHSQKTPRTRVGVSKVENVHCISRGRATNGLKARARVLLSPRGGGNPSQGLLATGVASNTISNDRQRSDQYHLIWSLGFLRKMILSGLVWVAVLLFIGNVPLPPLIADIAHPALQQGCHEGIMGAPMNRFSRNIALPLLSSSCCIVQLAINAISGWGCAGFNTYLGPIRPYILSAYVISTLKLFKSRSLAWTFASLVVAFMPELAYAWNSLRSRRWQVDGAANSNANTTSTDPMVGGVTATLRLQIPSMGCVACVGKIDRSIRACASSNILKETSWLNEGSKKGGMAEVTLAASSTEEVGTIVDGIVESVTSAGFECEMDRLDFAVDDKE